MWRAGIRVWSPTAIPPKWHQRGLERGGGQSDSESKEEYPLPPSHRGKEVGYDP